MFDREEFEKLKTEKESLYKTFGEVYCPYFKEKVLFNAAGMDHLYFKDYRKPRPEEDQYMRFKLLHLAPEVVRKSGTLQGYRITKKFERIRKNNKTEAILMLVTYYEFIAMIKRDRVRIVIKQIGSGSRFFLSVIPFWGMNSQKDRTFLEGDPEQE
jgi:hypothetical protein